jgi:thiamine kinase-like enzyme
MQVLLGKPLERVWDDLSEDQKAAVTQQLHGTFARVRSLPAPSPVAFSNAAGGPVQHRFFKLIRANPAITDPFTDEAAFHRAIAQRLHRDQTQSSVPDFASDFFQRHLAATMGHHACVFTHGDLQLKNILVLVEEPPELQYHASSSGVATKPPATAVLVSGVVDWEDAGWMPSYWEHSTMFMFANWSHDWIIKCESIVDAWPSEAAMLMFVRRNFDGF